MTTTVVRGSALEPWLEQRRRLGLDGHDEVWEGVLHVPPHAGWLHGAVHDELKAALRPYAHLAGYVSAAEFNLGSVGDYRVPDGGWVPRGTAARRWMPTVTVVLEVLSDDDETYDKFAFYAEHDVREILVADPRRRRVHCYAVDGPEFVEQPVSAVFQVAMAHLEEEIEWPSTPGLT